MTAFEGIVQRSGLGVGTWFLVTRDGTNYEIYQGAPKDLLQPGIKVKVDGQIRDDVVAIAMLDPVLEVKSFELLDEYP